MIGRPISKFKIRDREGMKAKIDIQKEEDCRIFDAMKGLLPPIPDGCLECFEDEYWEELSEQQI